MVEGERMDLGGERRRVVVIGGGVAGSLVAKSLQFHSDLTLIDQKEYFEIPWARQRAMVDPEFGQRSVINHRDYLTNGRLVASTAIGITDTQVLTAEGRLIAYDYLVIAAAHSSPAPPKTRAERLDQYRQDYERISSSHSILIVGGGPTGVELAGEIAVDFPEKNLTLVHSGSRLLEFVGQKASDKTMKWLAAKKVEVKLDRTVILEHDDDSASGGGKAAAATTYMTSSGESVEADCHFSCTGTPLGSEWLGGTALKNSLDGQGRLMVDEYLRVKGRENVFAIGDITDVQESKLGYLAQKHALVAAKNLRVVMGGEEERKLEAYRPRPFKAIVSLGRRDAVAQLSFTTVIGAIPGLVKSRDLFVGKTRKKLGLEPHTVYEY